MGELILLQEYKNKLIEKEVEDLRVQLQKIIEEYDITVEKLPYFEYDLNDKIDFTYMLYVTPPDCY